MGNRILTIEIGNSILKICEMAYKAKKPEIFQCFHFPTPPGVIDDGVVQVTDELVASLTAALKQKKIKTKKVVYTVASNKVATREVDLPFAKKPEMYANMIAANAQEYFPVDISQYELCNNVLYEFDAQDGKRVHVRVYATPNYLIESYRKLSEACGLTLVSLDFVGNSIANIFQGEFGEGVHLTIKMDELSCLLTVFNDDRITFQRSANSGVDAAIHAMQNHPEFSGKMPFSEAIRRFRTGQMIQSRLLSYDEMRSLREGLELVSTGNGDPFITDALRDMVNGISRIIDFYNAQNSQQPIQDVFLTGIGAEFLGMNELIANELQKITTVKQRSSNVKLNSKIAKTSIGAYSACIGAGINPLLKLDKTKKKKKVGIDQTNMVRVGVLGFSIFAIGAVGLAVAALIPYKAAVTQKEYNQEQYDRLVDAQKMISDYQYIELAYNDLMKVEQYTKNPNEQLLDTLSKLESNLPSNISITNMSLSSTDMVINLEAPTREDMGHTLQQLRDFEIFSSISCDGYNVQKNEETGEETVMFVVNCTYAPMEGAVTEEAEEGSGEMTLEEKVKAQNEAILNADKPAEEESTSTEGAE